jgi:hypothetical protein
VSNPWLLAGDVCVSVLIAVNFALMFRYVRLVRDVSQLRRSFLPDMVESFTAIASRVCPFCASTQGDAQPMVTKIEGGDEVIHDDAGIPAEVDEEADGFHKVRVRGRVFNMPCAAAELRKLTGKMFVDYMKEQEARKR